MHLHLDPALKMFAPVGEGPGRERAQILPGHLLGSLVLEFEAAQKFGHVQGQKIAVEADDGQLLPLLAVDVPVFEEHEDLALLRVGVDEAFGGDDGGARFGLG